VPRDVEVPINLPGTNERRLRAPQANRAVESTNQEEDLVRNRPVLAVLTVPGV
jgi:hypothetical protein